jgi:hypothetical protein
MHYLFIKYVTSEGTAVSYLTFFNLWTAEFLASLPEPVTWKYQNLRAYIFISACVSDRKKKVLENKELSAEGVKGNNVSNKNVY